MVTYTDSLDGVAPEQLAGFCEGWRNRPTPSRFLEALQGCSHVILAKDGDRIVGFVCAISDGVMFSYVPMLEVVKDRQKEGIGTELMRRLIDRCRSLYGVDLLCDESLVPYYQRFGMQRVAGMCLRRKA